MILLKSPNAFFFYWFVCLVVMTRVLRLAWEKKLCRMQLALLLVIVVSLGSLALWSLYSLFNRTLVDYEHGAPQGDAKRLFYQNVIRKSHE